MASGKSALKDPLGKHNNLQVYRQVATTCKCIFYIRLRRITKRITKRIAKRIAKRHAFIIAESDRTLGKSNILSKDTGLPSPSANGIRQFGYSSFVPG